jgi:Tol biopolymer transport system component
LARLKSPAEFQPIYWGVAWSPDNEFVYFVKRNDRRAPFVLFRIPAAGGAEERVGLEGADIRDLDISLDGTRIVFSLGATEQPEIWAVDNFLP